MIFTRGMRDKISKYADPSGDIVVEMSISGRSVYDFCCFGVDKSEKLSDDRYMIFYNQTSSPREEIRYQAGNNSASFTIRLASLPNFIDKLVFTASIDGNGIMGDISQHKVSISQNGSEKITVDLKGSDFKQEKAIISVEIYRKDEWRINAIASGFNGGLPVLLRKYGGEESTSSAPQPAMQVRTAPQPVQAPPIRTAPQPIPTPQYQAAPNPMSTPQYQSVPQPIFSPQNQKITPPMSSPQYQAAPNPMSVPQSFPAPQMHIGNQGQSRSGGVVLKKNEKELTQEIMGKISLSKDKVNLEKHVVNLSKCVVDLSKKSGVDLGSTRAKVVVVLDYSGSMNGLYANGTVQRTINRLVPLGLTFDDNGTIDVFLFSSTYKKLDDLNLYNYENYVNNVAVRSSVHMSGTNYAPVLRAIIEGDTQQTGFLFMKSEYTPPIVDNGDPTFILFITDGENSDRSPTDNIIRKSSTMNVFIQFIGIGNAQFRYLEQLDDMPGRARDNTGFSKMQSLDNASDQELYTNVLDQFSKWLRGLQ